MNELSFKPKINDIVEVAEQDQIIVMKVREKRKPWIYTVIVAIVALVIGGTSLWFQSQGRLHTSCLENKNSSKKNTSEFSYRSSSSNSSSSSSEPGAPVIETSAEALRDMENDGTLKTGQRYRSHVLDKANGRIIRDISRNLILTTPFGLRLAMLLSQVLRSNHEITHHRLDRRDENHFHS